jgi:hypothetical protein
MKKKILFFSFILIILTIGFFSTITSINENSPNNLNNNQNKTNQENNLKSKFNNLPENTLNYLKEFVNSSGMDSENIENISLLDYNSLPKDVDLKNIHDNNLAIYQIDFSSNNTREKQKLYMITYSTNKLEKQSDLIISEDKRSLLNFGIPTTITESQFMESATGIVGSLNKGYVMMRKGSITGISTNLEALNGEGSVEIIVYKNGEKINFGNEFVINGKETKKDYDIQSKGISEFEAGDIISIYAKISGNVSIKDVNTLLEIVSY